MFQTLKLILIYIISACAQTTTTTCTNEPKIYKLDIREYVSNLQAGSTIANIDSQLLCQQIYDYDYIWLSQLWTPSKFNYQNNLNAQPASNYKTIQNIKEYVLDPVLGTSSDFLQFQQSLKSFCYHIKFLGEFSFYIGTDSPLVYNKTRFFQIPYDQISIDYNPRYDNDGFVWAVDDFGRILPNTVVWNIFSKIPLQDISDIIYRQILLQYNLDGIVFLRPSLGLYDFNNYFFGPEISFFGQTSYFKDFYVNFGLKFTDTQYYFMGGEDNSNNEYKLLNAGLQQIYQARTNYDYVWQNINFTFDSDKHHNYLTVDNLSLSSSSSQTRSGMIAFVAQDNSLTQKSCFRVNFTNSQECAGGVGIYGSIVNHGYLARNLLQNYEYGNHGGKMAYNGDSTLNFKTDVVFDCSKFDQLEVQFDPITQMLKVMKFKSKVFFKIYVNSNPSGLRYYTFLSDYSQQLIISFPFYFSQLYKSSQASVKGDRNLLAISSNQTLQYAQIEPSINQLNITKLNILIQNIPSGLVGVGVCDRDLMNYKKHMANIQLGWGAYIVFSNGLVQHSDSNTYNNKVQDFTYTTNSIIQITYDPNTKELSFQNSQSNSYKMLISRKIKNINFCVAFNDQNTAFYLSY